MGWGGIGYFVSCSGLDAFTAFLTIKTPQRERLLNSPFSKGLNDESVTLLAPVNHRSCDILLANWSTGNGEDWT